MMKSGMKEKWWKISKRATYYQPGDGRTVTKAGNETQCESRRKDGKANSFHRLVVALCTLKSLVYLIYEEDDPRNS